MFHRGCRGYEKRQKLKYYHVKPHEGQASDCGSSRKGPFTNGDLQAWQRSRQPGTALRYTQWVSPLISWLLFTDLESQKPSSPRSSSLDVLSPSGATPSRPKQASEPSECKKSLDDFDLDVLLSPASGLRKTGFVPAIFA